MNIKSEIILHSVNTTTGDELVSFGLEFPRYILAEVNTHREFSKNSASSRAIPFKRMVSSVVDGSFVPLAFQKNHSGMQGKEYFAFDELFEIENEIFVPSKGHGFTMEIHESLMGQKLTLHDWWLAIKDVFVTHAMAFQSLPDDGSGVTKQLCNRLLEPFLAHKIILTTSISGLENYFKLRCPSYQKSSDLVDYSAKSINELIENMKSLGESQETIDFIKTMSYIERQAMNEGQADIHIMELAESMYDGYRSSVPKPLNEGEWHIPYGDDIDDGLSLDAMMEKLMKDGKDSETAYETAKKMVEDGSVRRMIASVRCARLSYLTLGDNPEINYYKDIELYGILTKSEHWSPFEHIGRAMTMDEYRRNIRGKVMFVGDIDYPADAHSENYIALGEGACVRREHAGWSRNLKGFIQYRSLLD